MKDRKGNVTLLYRLIPEEEHHLPHFLNIKAKLTPRQFIIKKGLRHKLVVV